MLTLNFEPFPVLTTERLVLRKLRDGDAEEVLYLRSHKDLMHFVPRPLLKDREDAKTFIHGNLELLFRQEAVNWAITTKEADKVIGILGLFNFKKEHLRCEVGYILHDGWHGKGIMNEALAAVVHYGFSVLQLHSVEALIDPANIASAKVAEKNNFTKEAHFKENVFYNGRFMDTCVYSLLTPFR